MFVGAAAASVTDGADVGTARSLRFRYTVRRGDNDADGIEVRIATGRVPFGLANAVAAVPGLELVRLTRDGAGRWLLEGRRVSPVSIPRERFDQVAQPLTESAGQPHTQSAARPPTAAAVKSENPAGIEVAGSIDGAPVGTTGDAADSTISHTANHEDPGT